MQTIYFYNTQKGSPGVNKILFTLANHLKDENIQSKIVDNLDILDREQIIIPYGIRAAYNMLLKKYPLSYCIMADAYTIGWLKKVLFYLKRLKFNYYDLYYSLYQILKYGFKEFIVLKNAKKIMYVSPYDIEKIKKIFPRKKYILVQNGVNIDSDFDDLVPKDEIILGSISNWNKTSRDEIRWFIEDYFIKVRKKNPNIKLLLAGYCSDESLKLYFQSTNGIEFLGEVKNLNDFFSRINIFVATIPKGVGILNKVLDSFAHQKLVIGLPECFYAFPNNKNGFITFSTYKSFLSALNTFINNKNLVNKLIENSYCYVQKYHDWNNNYKIFTSDILLNYNLTK